MSCHITQAGPSDAPAIAELVGELLHEVMASTGTRAFGFSPLATAARARSWLADGSYTILLASEGGTVIGFLALSESRALYAEGAFGTIPEFYVRPACRSRKVGATLLTEVTALARARGWTRLEVTTPPLPQFDRTFAFYEQQGFHLSGGRKMSLDLA